jgi:hypothetical protein
MMYGTPVNATATGLVTTGGGRLVGFYVNSTSSGTLVLRDGGASGRTLTGTITPAVGFHWFPASLATNLHVTVANTIDVTFFVN